MANPKSLRTVSAAIPLELHARLVAYTHNHDSTIGKILATAIRGVVGEYSNPREDHRNAVFSVAKIRELMVRLRRQCPRTYPPNAVVAITKVQTLAKPARASFIYSGDEFEHDRLLVELSAMLAKAKEETKVLADAWAAARTETPTL